MIRKLISVSGILFLTSAFPGPAQSRSRQPKNSGQITTKVDAYMKPVLDVNGFTGFVMVINHGKVLLSKGYGMANYELGVPNTAQTKFHLASVSKTFTAAAIMLLEERGLLKVTDPLTKFILDYPQGEKITIHHLLTNTSGIANINNFPEYNNWSKFPHTPADLLELFKHQPLDFEPGSRGYTESNSNYNLLAYIIEKLSGKAYGEFLRESIFAPLGMKDTDHDGNPESLLRNRASGYMPSGISDFDNAPYINFSIKTGNGSIYSTAEDLYKWDRALYTEKILKKATIEKMFNNNYGWFSGNRLNRRVTRMNGRQPGFQCELQRYIDDDLFIVVLGNSYITTPSLMVNDLAAMVFGEPYQIPEIGKPVRVESKTLDAYVGRYQFGPDFFAPNVITTIENRNGQLYSTSRGNNILSPQSEAKFFDRSVWAMITFVKDNQGRVTHFLWRYAGTDYRANKLRD